MFLACQTIEDQMYLVNEMEDEAGGSTGQWEIEQEGLKRNVTVKEGPQLLNELVTEQPAYGPQDTPRAYAEVSTPNLHLPQTGVQGAPPVYPKANRPIGRALTMTLQRYTLIFQGSLESQSVFVRSARPVSNPILYSSRLLRVHLSARETSRYPTHYPTSGCSLLDDWQPIPKQ